ncbi:hypothetical protein [Ectobacillus panaciterrae]|uniref:hypothetical protein n=1 Tax=Ectobacillus panaciterrae TaxID=363872 RepID=UPI00041FF1E7|nr:hypothetical protein [Ectobacillus panaciterrae]
MFIIIYFVIVAYRSEEVLKEQIENVKYYNPGCEVVLFNGGEDENFAKHLGVPICPYSRKLVYGKAAAFLYFTMRWLKEENIEFDYLVNLDPDMIFINYGFEEYVRTYMDGYDCMGGHMNILNTPHDTPHIQPTDDMWREWDYWKPFFNTEYFVRYLNPGQVYTKSILEKILQSTDLNVLEKMWSETKVHAIEEMIWPTLVMALGGKCRDYQFTYDYPLDQIRWRPYFSIAEILEKQKLSFFWVHPVTENVLLEYCKWHMNNERPL